MPTMTVQKEYTSYAGGVASESMEAIDGYQPRLFHDE